jgi:hypothetical protein
MLDWAAKRWARLGGSGLHRFHLVRVLMDCAGSWRRLEIDRQTRPKDGAEHVANRIVQFEHAIRNT